MAGGDDISTPAATLAAMGASLVGLGLARYCFDPLEPALVVAGWFSKGGAAFLAAANLGAYVFGAVFGAPLARKISATTLLRASMVAVTLSFWACSDRALSFGWFFAWRAVSGLGGGLIMVLATTTVLAHVEHDRRGFVSQMSLYGLSIGIVLAGAVVPFLIDHGVTWAWIGLGVASALVTGLTWSIWPAPPPWVPPPHDHQSPGTNRFYAQYALVAFGFVPHMIFLVDFIARDLDRGVRTGANFFLVYALGSVIGPFLLGALSGRIGVALTLRAALPVQLVAVALPLWSTSTLSLAVSCLLAGLCVPGLVSVFLARSQELAKGHLHFHRVIWGRATAAVAIAQAADAFFMAWLISRYASAYTVLFTVATVAMVLAMVLEVGSGSRTAASGRLSA